MGKNTKNNWPDSNSRWNFASKKMFTAPFSAYIFGTCFPWLLSLPFWKVFISLWGVASCWDNCVLRHLKTKMNHSLVVCGYLIIPTQPVAGYCLSCNELFALLANKPLAAHDTCFNCYLGVFFSVSLNVPLGSQWKRSLMVYQKSHYKGLQ